MKKQIILDAASATFLRHGFNAATTDMIQKQAEVSKATLYGLWSSKEALFAEVIERECAAMAHSIKEIKVVDGNITDMLSQLGRAYLNIVVSPTGLALFRVVIAAAPSFPELARVFWHSGPVTIASMLAELLNTLPGQEQMDFQRTGISLAAIQFVSLLRGEAQMECLMHPDAVPSAAAIDSWVRVAVETFVAAFRHTR